MKKLIFNFTLLILFFNIYSYELNKNINIRFGIPSKDGILIYKKGFVLLYDKNKKVPIWVSYHLTKKYYKNKIKSVYSFLPDPQLKKGQRAELDDYNKTIYSLCRLAPLDDMARDKEMIKEACYFSNVCLMNKELYNNCWKKLESVIRNFVKDGNDVWIVTGPLFMQKQQYIKKIGKNRIFVPTHFYKVILYQRKDRFFGASAYIFENRECKKISENNITTIDDIEKITNFDFFNLLPEYIQNLVESKKNPL
jgi:endonuclease G